MTEKEVIQKTADYAKKTLTGDASGHDWWHVYRVWKLALTIAKSEKADLFVVQLAALLHDVVDWKFSDKGSTTGGEAARDFLNKLKVDEKIVEQVSYIIDNISFKGIKYEKRILIKEAQIVQDADRLDALGAIGVARTIATGSARKRVLFNPDFPLNKISTDVSTKDSYSSIHHFYDKILLLKKLMNTRTGTIMAQSRHKFIELYLKEFFAEWEGKK